LHFHGLIPIVKSKEKLSANGIGVAGVSLVNDVSQSLYTRVAVPLNNACLSVSEKSAVSFFIAFQ